jgi:phenylacetic acid degradation operon negative regulatory protein
MKNINLAIKTPKIGPVGEAVLASIAAVGIVSVFALFPGMTCILSPFLKKRKFPRKQIIQNSVESLIQAGLVRKHTNRNGVVELELTQRGKWETFIRFRSKDTKTKNWDGLWRVVIFDVPVEKNKLRRELRRGMVLYGFKILQKSVWVYPYACDDFVALIKTHLGITNDVLYMKVEYIENDKHLRKEFSI